MKIYERNCILSFYFHISSFFISNHRFRVLIYELFTIYSDLSVCFEGTEREGEREGGKGGPGKDNPTPFSQAPPPRLPSMTSPAFTPPSHFPPLLPPSLPRLPPLSSLAPPDLCTQGKLAFLFIGRAGGREGEKGGEEKR